MAKGWVGAFERRDLFVAFICALIFMPFAPVRWFFAIIAASAVGFAAARRIGERLGGVNGDVLGACAVAAEILSLAIFAL